MNFQEIRDTLGQMDGKYQAKTEITVTVRQVKPVEYSQTSGKPGQSLYVELDSGEKDWVKFTGKDVEDYSLDRNAEKKQYILKIWPFKPDRSPKTNLYCWIQRQTAPQGSSQPSHTTAQATNPAEGGDITAQILAMAERFLTAIEQLSFPNVTPSRPTQPSGANPDYVGDDPPPPDDTDVPF